MMVDMAKRPIQVAKVVEVEVGLRPVSRLSTLRAQPMSFEGLRARRSYGFTSTSHNTGAILIESS